MSMPADVIDIPAEAIKTYRKNLLDDVEKIRSRALTEILKIDSLDKNRKAIKKADRDFLMGIYGTANDVINLINKNNTANGRTEIG